MNKTTDQSNTEAQVEAVNEVVAMLNVAFEADPAAIHALICNRVPCNEALADHPTILVDKQPVPGDRYAVGMLGVVNAVVQTLTGHRVASMWSETADAAGAHELLGFKAYLLPQIEPSVGNGTSKPVESIKLNAEAADTGPVKDGPKSKPWTIPGTGKVPTKDKSPVVDTELEATFNCCLHFAEQLEFNMRINDPDVVWYGPHECNGCGKSIVKSSIDTGGVALDFEHNSQYPNHEWKRHVCAGGAPKPVAK